jgi:plasmid stabilization system protein ParE
VAKRVVWTEGAWKDLQGIANFISRDSPYYAASFVREIRDCAGSLSRMSMRGHAVPEVADRQIRQVMVQGYRLLYKVEGSRVVVLGIIHGAKELKNIWARRSR